MVARWLLLRYFLFLFALAGDNLTLLWASFDCSGWSCRVTQPVRCSLFWPAAWLPAVDWSRSSKSVESALADAHCFAGGPVPDRGLVLRRGVVPLRVLRLGGPTVRQIRGNAVNPLDGRDVHMYRDSSIAPLLDLRRRFWDCVLGARPMHLISEYLLRVQDDGLV